MKSIEAKVFLGILASAFIWLFAVLPFMYSVPRLASNNELPADKCSGELNHNLNFWEKANCDPTAYFTLWLVGFTCVLSASTIGLWWVTWRGSIRQSGDMKASISTALDAAASAKRSADAAIDQVDISTQSLVISQRAFVALKGFEVFHMWDTTIAGPSRHIVGWQFTPLWENTGQTPTKGLQIITGIHSGPLPPNFKFENNKPSLSFLAPKGITHGESYHIGIPEMLEIAANRRVIYIWGRADYNDVFPGTRRHHTIFCHKIVCLGDPTVEQAGIRLTAHSIGNYSDEETASS